MSTRREVRLFEGEAPHVRAAPPSAAFLEVLAERLALDLADPDDPFALADATVLLPNRRAGRGLILVRLAPNSVHSQ
jgi:inactivated superfamily I helicase